MTLSLPIALALVLPSSSIAVDNTRVTSTPFGTTDGKAVRLFTLSKGNVEVKVMNYGATVVSIRTPDKNGTMDNVVFGYDSLAGYIKGTSYFGCVVGRYGNRIAGGKFTLDGKTHRLAINNGPNSLHGGKKGFDRRVWNAEQVQTANGAGIRFTYVSKDGEEGYPGQLTAKVTYSLSDAHSLKMDYEVTTNKPTVANLTNHSYFNLGGKDVHSILHHVVKLNADKFTPVNQTLIPTGELRSVEGTPFDFRTPTTFGLRIGQVDEQLGYGNGYDHNFVINGKAGTLRSFAYVFEPSSGRTMEGFTTEPGVQVYSGNFLNDREYVAGKRLHPFQSAFCMETQRFPDSPNQASFPSTVVRPGEVYRSTTIYRFGIYK